MIGSPAYLLLDQAVMIVNEAFPDGQCYFVGSARERRDYRDVDVRLILDDKAFLRHFPKSHPDAINDDGRVDALWSLICASISERLAKITGLPIDFQIQSQSHANRLYGEKSREPLGIFIRKPKGTL